MKNCPYSYNLPDAPPPFLHNEAHNLVADLTKGREDEVWKDAYHWRNVALG